MMKLFVVLLLAAVLTGGGLTYKRWEGEPPQVAFSRDFNSLGRAPMLAVTVEDNGTGLRHVSIHLKQKDQDVTLADEDLGKDKLKTYDLGRLIGEKYKVQDGPASLTVSAVYYSLRSFLKGNRTDVSKDFAFHVTPPTLEVLEGQHYINQGGSECVVYRVSENTEQSGVQVGDQFFPGIPVNGSEDKRLRFALFALKYDWPADTPLKVVARDAGGNEVTAGFWHKVFPKNFRSRDIPLDDKFVQKAVPEILSHSPDIKDQGDPVKNFVEVNSKVRKMNHENIAKLAAQSPAQFLWNGAFLQLSNSKVESFFADRRTYIHDG